MNHKRKKVFLHIGTHKTGTTSIQSFLSGSEDVLRANDIYYPPPFPNKNPGHHYAAQQLGSGRRIQDVRKHPLVEKLLKAIAATDITNVVISSELFSVIEPGRVHELFSEYECYVVCVLRRQDDFLESMYRELKKSSFFSGGAEDFAARIFAGEPLTIFKNKESELRGRLPIDYKQYLDAWVDCFGRERIMAYAYDDPAIKGDSLAALFMALAKEKPASKAGKTYNKSFEPIIVQVREAVDKSLPWDEAMLLRSAFWWANETRPAADRYYFYDTTDRKTIMGRLAASNARLGESYLMNSSAPWLTGVDVPDEYQKVPPLAIETALDVCGAMLTHQAGQIERQRAEIAELRKAVAELNKGQR